jgi:hypothetical protein
MAENVRINVGSLSDKKLGAQMDGEVNELLERLDS